MSKFSHRLLDKLRELDNGSEPPDDEGMEARVAKLEGFAAEARDRLIKIEARLEQTATKSDLADAINSQIKWMVGTAVVLGGLGISVMTFVLNNAVPKSAPSPQPPQPIVVYAQPSIPPLPPAPQSPPSPKR